MRASALGQWECPCSSAPGCALVLHACYAMLCVHAQSTYLLAVRNQLSFCRDTTARAKSAAGTRGTRTPAGSFLRNLVANDDDASRFVSETMEVRCLLLKEHWGVVRKLLLDKLQPAESTSEAPAAPETDLELITTHLGKEDMPTAEGASGQIVAFPLCSRALHSWQTTLSQLLKARLVFANTHTPSF
jgi:hypothetical protein